MNIALGAFWFFYFAGYGIFFPYFALYLSQDQGLSGTQVGLILGVMPCVGLLAQPLWGQVADRTGSRRGVLAIAVAGAAAAHLALGRLDGFPRVLAATAALALFSTTVVPLATAVSLAVQNRSDGSGFGRVRLWGTLGFLVTVVGFPRLLAHLPPGPGSSGQDLGWMFPAIAGLSLLAVPAALVLPRTHSLTERSAAGDTRRLLRHPPVRLLLLTVFAAQL
ncbi:MAG: MFS transporter, partial [Acidobacteriota bacterium]